MRHKIMDQPTALQSKVARSVATADIGNDQIDGKTTELKEVSDDKTEKKSKNSKGKLFIHYTHEKRFESLPRNMHQVFENVFKNTNAMDLKLIVGNRNRREAKKELIHKRPKRSILQYKMIKNKYLKFLGKVLF